MAARNIALGSRVQTLAHGVEGVVAENGTLACGRGELGQLEVGRGGLEARLEVVEADGWEKIEGVAGAVIIYIVGPVVSAAKGK